MRYFQMIILLICTTLHAQDPSFWELHKLSMGAVIKCGLKAALIYGIKKSVGTVIKHPCSYLLKKVVHQITPATWQHWFAHKNENRGTLLATQLTALEQRIIFLESRLCTDDDRKVVATLKSDYQNMLLMQSQQIMGVLKKTK